MRGFPRSHRLASKHEFQQVFDTNSKINQKCFSVRSCSTTNSFARLGIIVPKSAIKQAVKRNLIRRIVRESFRLHQQGLKRLDIVVMIRPECLVHDKKSLRVEIDKLWPLLANTPD